MSVKQVEKRFKFWRVGISLAATVIDALASLRGRGDESFVTNEPVKRAKLYVRIYASLPYLMTEHYNFHT